VNVPLLPTAYESPSLSAKGIGAAPAFELKFLIDEAAAHAVEAWAGQHLVLDPHGDPTLSGAYLTTSLYFDTAKLDVFHRSSSHKRRKFRVRRYGAAPWTFLERKSKWGDRVEKRRTTLPDEELPLLAHPMSLITWAGHWFHRRLQMRRLGPACQISYVRTAFVGACPESPLRLTLDRRIFGAPTKAWQIVPSSAGKPLLTGQVILELKFRNALPAPFKGLVGDLRLNPGPVSKYRLCVETWGSTNPKAADHEATHADTAFLPEASRIADA
jgi:hypothetical protein